MPLIYVQLYLVTAHFLFHKPVQYIFKDVFENDITKNGEKT